jgi:uncharacterized protein YkwD
MAKTHTKKRPVSLRAHVKKHVKLAVVPHKANQYRPHAIRRYGIIAIVVFVLFAQGIHSSFFVHSSILGTQAQITPAGLLAETNSARAKQNEQPLVLNAELTKAAKLKVQSMFDQQYWAHVAPDGTTPWHWFNEVNYAYSEAGENLAKNFTSSAGTVNAWVASPSHRANVLKADYKDVGFAVMDGTLEGKPTTLVVALYGTPEELATQGVLASTQASELDTPVSIMAQIGIGLRTMTPVTIASVVLLLLAANVALVAHMYRRKLPVGLRRSWYRHHGLYKAIGLTSLAIVLVVAYGGIGQI